MAEVNVRRWGTGDAEPHQPTGTRQRFMPR